MSCHDCDNRFREYLIFRSAVVRFANFLDDLEAERQRIIEESRPENAPPLMNIKAVLRDKEPTIASGEAGPLMKAALADSHESL